VSPAKTGGFNPGNESWMVQIACSFSEFSV
jgi:hypothetical protein